MKPLSTLDSMIVTLDHEKFPMHGLAIMVLDPTTSPVPFTYEHLKEHVRRLLPKLPVFRRRLMKTPLGLSVPLWVEDPDFDIRRHVHHVTLPAPGSDRDFARLADDVTHVPVDWSRPLWDMWFVDGLADGKVGYILKLHHCTSDITGGNEMMFELFSAESDPPKPDIPDPWLPDRIPTRRERLVIARPDILAYPVRSVRALVGVVRGVSRARRTRNPNGAIASRTRLFRGARLPFNQVPSGIPHRVTSWSTVRMEDVQAIRRIHGGTVNDVGMAIYTGALRRWLSANGILPSVPLTCSVAKSLRPDADEQALNNLFDVMALSLPTNEADADVRMRSVVQATSRAKAQVAASNTNIVENAFSILTPGMAKGALAAAIAVLGKKMPAPYNTSVTSLRATDGPMFLAGARLERYYVQLTPSAGVSLMCAIVTYNGTMHISAVGHRENTPDVWSLIAGVDLEVQELLHSEPAASKAK